LKLAHGNEVFTAEQTGCRPFRPAKIVSVHLP
jgi:hypothetical protein